MSSRSRRSADSKGLASVSRGPPSSSPQRGEDKDHTYLTVKLPSSKLRQATASRTGNQISVGGGRDSYGSTRRSARGGKKSYVVESSEDEEEEEEEEEEEQDEIEVGGERLDDDEDEEEDEEMEDLGDEDADGEVVEDDDMDVDAEGEDDDLGEEDAEGDIDMDVAPPPPTIKISKPAKGAASSKAKNAPPPKRTGKAAPVAQQTPDDDDDDDDEELSDLESDEDDEEINATMDIGGDEDAEGEEEEEDVDAEGEEIEVAEEDEEDDLDSDNETPGGGSRGETPDLAKMTVRQRARFEEPNPAQYQALSNEIQAKKVFTAEEISMRRAEMARRRRNLSEKRNEEVKMETINKLLKKQAPKTNRKAQAAGDETPDVDANRPNPIFIRWISSKEGSRVAVTEEIMDGPVGNVFKAHTGSKMVQEVS
ncbi:putative papa-1-like conserved region family protein [Phaeoacremonium minimum UCRPA7]|uniref:Putative papa-1-like conserved region family protein n=1 Tax=Phaeoacremonium minimum (strain UCR-PA7) TaxID=1286976 RepID=R8BM17_PHAM7|nr:putative papa-1-like conserved region family protein [Phaeoacremonium minimum UCRPA7]EOO00394.1 putative papa-1-like conserved region family protein [Phaeoacremonium minimum UCRPA7]